ncbi:VOC family protein [Nocardia sp. NPDC051052]|uniref:VOC family protein n=1 Tax=Nocardia sp. NPDC051052 TaxID=3364322 RepID=UPI00379C6642
MPTPWIFRIVIPVDDIEAATKFYSAILKTPGERVWVNRHYFRCGEVILACVEPGPESGDFHIDDDPRVIYLGVDDLEETMELVRRAEPAHIDASIEAQAWGERSFYAQDPFGTRLCFVHGSTIYAGGDFEE